MPARPAPNRLHWAWWCVIGALIVVSFGAALLPDTVAYRDRLGSGAGALLILVILGILAVRLVDSQRHVPDRTDTWANRASGLVILGGLLLLFAVISLWKLALAIAG